MNRTFLHWPGGKARLLKHILPHLEGRRTLIEPFCGAGSVFLNATNSIKKVADINPDLINLFMTLKNRGNDFIDACESLFLTGNNETDYYIFRKQFNQTDDVFEKSVLFVYLNRHCYNGLWRYNSQGEFNVAFRGEQNKIPRKIIFPREEMTNCCNLIQNIEFFCCSFEKMFEMADENCAIYCDPPYISLNSTSNFTSYSKEAFGIDEQRKLAEQVKNSNCKVVVSNRDTELIREMYAGMTLIPLDVQRNISCKGNKRIKDKELLIVKE